MGDYMAKATRRSASRRRGARGKNGRTARKVRAAPATTMSRLGNGAAQLTRNASNAGRRLQRDVGAAVEENPLIVGAALFVAGAALGYAMRGLLTDNLWLDEQRHAMMDKGQAVMDRARDLARTASDKVGSLRQNRSGEPNETHS
jgi:hypothetical protein